LSERWVEYCVNQEAEQQHKTYAAGVKQTFGTEAARRKCVVCVGAGEKQSPPADERRSGCFAENSWLCSLYQRPWEFLRITL
jgi:hypothetical protein